MVLTKLYQLQFTFINDVIIIAFDICIIDNSVLTELHLFFITNIQQSIKNLFY